ncbi:protein of unknown function [Chryseobacterium sp. JV274]|nr:protein of unknown function [Chryseobacterium sp. JV274]
MLLVKPFVTFVFKKNFYSKKIPMKNHRDYYYKDNQLIY